ncbi:MAG TPA: bifunctional DNA-formamidopyrimidine glycosylase/DNA-(apurinic or apyrimidinic site) lyase [Candidatus Nanopelagicales bacterium]
MPELPEVEVVRRGLAGHVLGATLAGIEVLHPRAVRRQPGGPAELVALLSGRTITATGRRGKFLWLATDDPGLVLDAHLGMSGQFRVDAPAGAATILGEDGPVEAVDAGPRRHARVRFALADDRQLWFVDQRTFGWVAADWLVADPAGVPVPTLVRAIAPDPTEPGFDPRVVARAMRHHRVEVKRLLLDQSLVSGVGNIYADEALWRAGVHPRRRADRMALADLVRVLEAAAAVMAEALAAGGTSFDSLYVNVNGESGYFARGLAVYGRAGLPCPRCGTPIVRERFTNRSSHLCPTCQRPPRARH